MELILTSFGLSHLNQNIGYSPDIFYRLPPLSMSSFGNKDFIPDYAVFLLCERIILDLKTWEKLIVDKHNPAYRKTGELMRSLYEEGFVRIEDFDSIIMENSELLENMLQHDLKRMDDWVAPLYESVRIWNRFMGPRRDSLSNLIPSLPRLYFTHNILDIMPFIAIAAYTSYEPLEVNYHLMKQFHETSYKKPISRSKEALKKVLEQYLSHVNANLVVSQTIEAPFHDWHDYAPFYREKFLSIGREGQPHHEKIQTVKKLFEVSFPEFTFWKPKDIIKALKDKRIVDLRTLVDQASKGEIEFDQKFANQILREVFKGERKTERIANIVSWLTLPIGFIPIVGTPLQKGMEELLVRLKKHKVRKKYRWFYLITELAQDNELKND